MHRFIIVRNSLCVNFLHPKWLSLFRQFGDVLRRLDRLSSAQPRQVGAGVVEPGCEALAHGGGEFRFRFCQVDGLADVPLEVVEFHRVVIEEADQFMISHPDRTAEAVRAVESEVRIMPE